MNPIKNIFLVMLVALLPLSAHSAEVEFHTTKGMMVLDIDEASVPVTAKNFLQYVKDGFYDGLIFHRVIPGFVIQGGGFTEEMVKRETRAPIQHEGDKSPKNLRYTLSMARTNDPHSASSQFFINLNDNIPLDPNAQSPGYVVFGKVISGQEVVDAIAAAETTTKGYYKDVPVEPIVITETKIR